ncbi:MAG: DNA-3-methyladenine glycosylase I [Pseudomonadales bacterium]|nr:DNA-3-methyladenine glycosylase I [Pseudomonadales bacterium]
MKKTQRCSWCGTDELYMRYHDKEWGVPLHDGHGLFELLVMEGMQAGLSWITILRKRKQTRKLLLELNPNKLANFGSDFINNIMKEEGIIHHRGKLEASIKNARAFIALGSTTDAAKFLWSFTGGETLLNCWESRSDVPTFTSESTSMAKCLKKKGFRYVGPTICYAFMQSAGMVNDHLVGCFRHKECAKTGAIRHLVE